MPKVVVFSFFSGVGILDLAFETSGYEIVFVNEYEQNFLNAYQYSRRQLQMNAPLYGYSSKNAIAFTKGRNKRKLIKLIEQEKSKGNIVGFIGGPPCPDFSIGGKNKGADGKNGRLTKTYFNLIVRCRPNFFLFENVKGLVKTEKHKKFYKEMKMKVTNSGYVISDKTINALSYGVPQFRERILMIGLEEGFSRNKNAIVVDGNNCFSFPWEQKQSYDIDDLMQMKWPTTEKFEENGKREFIYNVPKELTVEYWFNKNNVVTHANQSSQFGVKCGKSKMISTEEGDTKRKSFKRLHRWRYSPTAAYGNNEVHLHPYEIRRLSVAEAMAIQSLPSDFLLPPNVPLTYMFKMIGNGVPYLMAKCIAETLYEFLGKIN